MGEEREIDIGIVGDVSLFKRLGPVDPLLRRADLDHHRYSVPNAYSDGINQGARFVVKLPSLR